MDEVLQAVYLISEYTGEIKFAKRLQIEFAISPYAPTPKYWFIFIGSKKSKQSTYLLMHVNSFKHHTIDNKVTIYCIIVR